MKTCFSIFALALAITELAAQSTTTIYQGRLNDGVGLATGGYDLRFSFHDSALGGTAVSGIVTNNRGGGTELRRLDVSGNLSVRGVVVQNILLTSDREAKENITPVNARAVLEKVSTPPVSEWNFKGDATRHIGPMAQDFHAAFQVGEDDKHIAVVDEGGVALAAIQGLNQKLEEQLKRKDARLAALENQLAELKGRDAENAGLKKRLTALERVIAGFSEVR